MERNCKEITGSESLQFPSLFSRLVFIAQKYDLPKALEWQLQNIRVKSSFLLRNENNLVSPSQYQRGKEAIIAFLSIIDGNKIDVYQAQQEETDKPITSDKVRVQVIDIDREHNILLCQPDVLYSDTIHVKYGTSSNNIFNDTIESLWVGAQLNLIDSKIDNNGCYIPKLFVLEPDYLIDASAIAECFQNYGNSHLHYFRRKFEPSVNSHYILLGNLANFFLDELIYADNADDMSFEEIFLKSFRAMPFEYSSCEDIRKNDDFRDFMHRAKVQFENIKRVVLNDMPANGFDIQSCILEPSFFSEKYGFQGRLDLLQLPSESGNMSRIIELKSGKPPYPREDVTKIASNHETQTAVYRLMIQSVFDRDARQVYATILYSAAENAGENIRLAAPYQQLEKEIINIRNLIVATEHKLYTGDEQTVVDMFDQMFDLDNYGRVPQFFIDKLTEIKKVVDNASDIEKAYFYRYINFVSRELYLLKMGDEGYNSSMSVSALWNTTFEERKEALELIADLEIEAIDDSARSMTILFKRAETRDVVNFREGEICILYPRQNETHTILTNQILKGTVVELLADHILLRFRYKQQNRTFFSKYRYWVVEHDKLDHSYNSMFKSLFSFLSAPSHKKDLLLGLQAPFSSHIEPQTNTSGKEQKRNNVIEKAIAANDYFLIVGPPGTGKTSIFARQLIERFHSHKDTNILVMAYTNRAVDELCDAIESALEGHDSNYIRIGSELSCGEKYREHLLQNIADNAGTRKELVNRIDQTRIFVGTLASVIGKPELFGIKKFDVAIIDEASQILEAQIIGILPLFRKFVMIGDHKQLSTITLQSEYKSGVKNELLNEIELHDCRESLFERLFRKCKKEGWTQAYDTLTYHGRMHEDISVFVNHNFYENCLTPATDRQTAPLHFPKYDANCYYQRIIAANRLAFIPVRHSDNTNLSDKTNKEEADIAVALANALVKLYKANNIDFDCNRTLGIITPYRNQIALIKQGLEDTGIPELKNTMVDTVERYQGSQRDVIILSFCFNQPYQIQFFANMDREGIVDRKLNVALTRAREQLFLIGNDYILQQNNIYRNLLANLMHYPHP